MKTGGQTGNEEFGKRNRKLKEIGEMEFLNITTLSIKIFPFSSKEFQTGFKMKILSFAYFPSAMLSFFFLMIPKILPIRCKAESKSKMPWSVVAL